MQRFSSEQIVRFYLVVSWSRAAHFGAFHIWSKLLNTDRCLIRFDSDMFDGIGDGPDKNIKLFLYFLRLLAITFW